MLFFGRGFDNNVVAGLPYFFFLFPISTGFLLIICFILLSSFFFFVSFAPGCMEGSVVVRACVRCKCGAVCVCVWVCKFTTLLVCLWFFFSVLFIFHLLIYNKLIKKKKRELCPTHLQSKTHQPTLFSSAVLLNIGKRGLLTYRCGGQWRAQDLTVTSLRTYACVRFFLFACLPPRWPS